MRIADRAPRFLVRESNGDSRLRSRQDFEAFLESVCLERLLPFLVVVRVIRIEPIALGIDVEIGDLGEFRRLNQELSFGDKARDELDFGFIQVELATVEIAIHVGIREEDLCGAAFDDYVEDVRALQFVERLR